MQLMKLSIASALIAATLSAAALAQYPSKPVRVVVPFPPGSATDTVTRIIARPLSESLGRPVVVENRAGGDGSIAALEVMRAAPDGHTLLMATASAMSAVPSLRKQPPYDAIRDFSPISFIGNYTFFLLVNASVPARSLAELIAHAKANPGKLNYATGNSTGIAATAQLIALAGIDMVHVPYKGEPPAIAELLSGQVHVMFATPTTALAMVKEGKLRALVTTNRNRTHLAPDVPTMAEAGMSKLTIAPWGGLFGPAGLPREIADRLSREIAAVYKRPEVRESLDRQGLEYSSSTPEELDAFLKEQLEAWRRVVREAGIRQE